MIKILQIIFIVGLFHTIQHLLFGMLLLLWTFKCFHTHPLALGLRMSMLILNFRSKVRITILTPPMERVCNIPLLLALLLLPLPVPMYSWSIGA